MLHTDREGHHERVNRVGTVRIRDRQAVHIGRPKFEKMINLGDFFVNLRGKYQSEHLIL